MGTGMGMGMERGIVVWGLVFAGVFALLIGCASESSRPAGREHEETVGGGGDGAVDMDETTVLDRTMNLIDGTPQDLSEYRGDVVLIVNVASRCGLTPQYEGLQALYEQKRGEGFVVLGFPANDFGGQEPGTNKEIASFCANEYGVTFPVFEKIQVTGGGKHALYAELAGLPEPLGGEPAWNFTKFLLDRSGRVVARFEPRTSPDDPEVVGAIERLLDSEG